MKLSVSAFRAQASAQRKILSSYQNQLNYGACTSYPALGGYKFEEKLHMMVDSTEVNPGDTAKSDERTRYSDNPEGGEDPQASGARESPECDPPPTSTRAPEEGCLASDSKAPGRTRSKSNQRWMKLRTTVQLSGAISSTNQKSKPPLKREDSFLKRFSTRQIPEAQETVDTGDEAETLGGSQTQNEVNRRRRKRRKEMSKTVVNPDENFYFYWLMTVTVCVLYNLWTLIVRQSFPELQAVASAFWHSCDGFTDVVFVCDIVVQFRTGYLEQGLMVYNSRKLATHYLKSRAFVLDVLSLLPLDFLQLSIGMNPMLRFPRFLKIYRVYSYYYIVESRTVYPNLWRVVNLIHILLILAHWFGCFYYLLSEAEGFQGDWVYPYRPGDYATLTRKYLGSLYWSTLTLTTIGDLPTPETNAESRGRSKAMTSSGRSEGIPRRGHKSRLLQFNSDYGYLFTIISYLIGVFIFATIVGQVGNVITNRNANRLEFERLLDGAKTYMRHHKVPGGMKRRVLRWYDYSWSRGRIQGGGDINTALGLLPDKLKTELALHVNLSVLKKVTIFQECQPEFLHDLVLKMKAYIFTPGDLICRKGEVAREMFIIADGILDVISDTGRVLTTMRAGDFFGEIGILNLDGLNKRTADVRSVGYSELFSLSREDVLAAMKDYPEAQDILQSLGRKRLMEAKNASKMCKAQVKQAKDHDSSGESDTAGKRIVEKLRSDVKGLKNALRRSRRGTRYAETSDAAPENSSGKISSKKHSILRRMSHVQSSDEYEANNDAEQTPIGAGLPLLQRLKLLKEKQEKEREEKDLNKLIRGENERTKRDATSDGETSAFGRPFAGKLKLFKPKEIKDFANLGSLPVSSTVRTQVTGVRFDKTIPKQKAVSSARGVEKEVVRIRADKENLESRRTPPLKEAPKTVPAKVHQEADVISSPKFTSEPNYEVSVNLPLTKESVPKQFRTKCELPKGKDAWKLLKNSSISRSKPEGRYKSVGNDFIRKVSKKSFYLSKSDTVLERQRSWENGKEKSYNSPSKGDPSQTADGSATSTPKIEGRSGLGHRGGTSTEGIRENTRKRKMKKYNSISDLSPEYSGLPFVKKLKILNERQKLEELERELLVRSVSLDGSERSTAKRNSVLVRSRSEAGTVECMGSDGDGDTRKKGSCCQETPLAPTKDEHLEIRRADDEKSDRSWNHSEGSIASPESNETLERRRLKSILKKLSAEDATSGEGRTSRNSRWDAASGGPEGADFKKLMRAPTVEGYAARHKKLTKSVTFDRDTIAGPAHSLASGQPSEECQGKSFPPTSPTAILTLQLSNLSMIPIARPKADEGEEKGRIEEETDEEIIQMNSAMLKVTEQSQGEWGNECRKLDEEEQGFTFMLPYILQELIDKNVRSLPFIKSLDDDFFNEIKLGIFQVFQQILEEIQSKFQTQLENLLREVEKRDEIIFQLRSKIQQLEENNELRGENRNESAGGSTENSGTDSDASEVSPEDDFETGNRSSNIKGNDSVIALDDDNFRPKSTCDRLGFLGYEEADKICLLPTGAGTSRCLFRRDVRRSMEPSSIEEMELAEFQGSFRSYDSTNRKKSRMEFHLIRNFSVDNCELEGAMRCEKSNDVKKPAESRSKTTFINRVTKLHRTFSCSQEKTADFLALDIDDSSNSSDSEKIHNKDWEVQMLVEELGKKDPSWEREEEKYCSDDVKKLQEEVDTLKRMVCDGGLTRLTGSELDMLETIIESKDERISQLEKSNSLDDSDKSKRLMNIYSSESDDKFKKCARSKKPSLRQKIGHALSFDFHDMDGGKPTAADAKLKAFSLGKQKTLSCSSEERRGLRDLWHASSRLRHRVLEDSGSCLPAPARSLPILPQRERRPRFAGRFTSSLGSFEETHQRVEFNESLEPAFEETEASREAAHRESQNVGSPPKSGFVSQNDCHPSNSLNNFIKSVGQKVKQVMAGDVNTVKNPVPTISKLCDEQMTSKNISSEGLSKLCGAPSEGDARSASDDPPNISDSSDKDTKTDLHDL